MPVICLLLIIAQAVTASEKGATANDDRVRNLLDRMTLEEKVGQMTQVTLEVISAGEKGRAEPHRIDPDKLAIAIKKYHVGSILNTVSSWYSVDHWHEIINAIQKMAREETRLAIPVLYGIDAIHGANYTEGATLFPQSIGMAATWRPDLVRKSAQITAEEMRACGIPWNFNPVLGAGRQPLWPRLWETFGEDVYLASVLGHAYVKGLEGEENKIGTDQTVASCIKHYIGYSFPFSGKDRTPAYIPERLLREHFLPIFKAGVDAGAHTLMVNSGEINGQPIHGSSYFLQDLLRGELGFEGFVVSDWGDVNRLNSRDRVAATEREAVRQAVMAGVDMSMVPLDYGFADHLIALVQEGAVPMSRIDEAVGRILDVKLKVGLFDEPFAKANLKEQFANPSSQQLALAAARESITLTKNNNRILPLKAGSRILVTGPGAHRMASLNGGWTITWQGNNEALYPKEKDTILEALQTQLGDANVSYVPGSDFEKELDIDAAVTAAKAVDAAVICIGEDAYCETPGNINDLNLPAAQRKLVKKVQATGTPVILVLTQGRPRIISDIEPDASAVVMAYLPGMEGGTAIADVLTGKVNPSGKLPITYPRHSNDITPYDHKAIESGKDIQESPAPYHPQWAFGHGLSYTTFEYSNLKLSGKKLRAGGSIDITVDVKNSGERSGKEVVQLYVSDLVASVSPHVRRLKNFSKISLDAGEQQTVKFTLLDEDLAFIGLDNKPVIEDGAFKIAIGPLTAGFQRGQDTR